MASHMTAVKKTDLEFLVKLALKHDEIDFTRAGELLALSLKDMRKLVAEWNDEWKTLEGINDPA